jgi:hypothetical protein
MQHCYNYVIGPYGEGIYTGCSPVIHSDSTTGEAPSQAAVTKVATLSNFDTAVTLEPMIAPKDSNTITEIASS